MRTRDFIHPLAPMKQKFNHRVVNSFDIETSHEGNVFELGIFSMCDGTFKVCKTPQEAIEFMKQDYRFKNCYVSCTNTGYDFFGTFFSSSEMKNFRILFRQSHLVYAETFIYGNEFHHENTRKGSKKISNSCIFIDTLNYIMASVETLGKIIGIEKLPHPRCFGSSPSSPEEYDELVVYCKNDALISRRFMDFIIKSFEELGATFKKTIASTAMNLFRNKYLDRKVYRHDVVILKELMKGYYGGRTEVFSRGMTGKCSYYDFNSMYASVMREKMPDPASLRIDRNNFSRIRKYEGMSLVEVNMPDMKYPPLPFRIGNKTVYPVGRFTGYFCHNELRHAIDCGCQVLKIFKTFYFKKTCTPFKRYVEELYELRKRYKAEGNPMEVTVKLLSNSLYGKFGQGFVDMDDWKHQSQLTEEDLEESQGEYEQIGEYIRLRKKEIEPSVFCFPEWAAYVTAYGRIKLHQTMIECERQGKEVYYCDTDSQMTEAALPCSDELGDLKLEHPIDCGILVKPKFYAIYNSKMQKTKIKGFARTSMAIYAGAEHKFSKEKPFLDFHDFQDFLKSPEVRYNKIGKFKECIRKGIPPNCEIPVTKRFLMEDDKRQWEQHDLLVLIKENKLISSKPIRLNVGFSGA